jgi:hypothetical protein
MYSYLYQEALKKGYFYAEYFINKNNYLNNIVIIPTSNENSMKAIRIVIEAIDIKGENINSHIDSFFNIIIENYKDEYEDSFDKNHKEDIIKYVKEQITKGIFIRFTELEIINSH